MKKEFRGLLVDDISKSNILLLGIPSDKNASVGKGASLAPKVLRELSYDLPPLDQRGNLLKDTYIYDLGDYELNDFDELSDTIYNDMMSKNSRLKLIFGGDHSVSIASQRAFFKLCKERNKEPVIIHIDAHPDICDSYKGSKFSHACPIKRALDFGFKDENITILGARGFEEQELGILKEHNKIDVYKSCDIKKLGVEALSLILASKYRNDKYAIYVSYDVDCNDPSFAPGTGTPEHFGLSSFETLDIINNLFKSLNVEVMDIVEVSPPLDVNNITSWLVLKQLYEIFHTIERKNEK